MNRKSKSRIDFRTLVVKEIFNKHVSIREIIFIALVLLCLSSFVSPPVALLLGVMTAQVMGHPYMHLNHRASHLLLQFSVVGLGFGMHAESALKAGREGLMLTVGSIIGTLVLGFVLHKVLKIEKKTAFLVSVGTAICGGSAIAAIAPVIKAQEKQISVALGVVFVLNSLALFLFPPIGHFLGLSQNTFGLWSAVAVHDTSSVVGVAAKYGSEALEVATTVKLARALWIIPVALCSSVIFRTKGSKIKIPYFIGLFILGMLLNTYVPSVRYISPYVVEISKSALTLTLFLIGCGLTRKTVAAVGGRLFIMGCLLWFVISVFAFWMVTSLGR
ncbi:YeiH family protein [Sinomicrobium weinanense]|uniref:Sulfate exporter family transporter n=1 Tax=Sinomicrobium weinanense TaxID=2842200 RepID=A0A926JVU0_9FLAO|nr:putative sulfate exporter family transporter [Sinomicrobium weinanense]MBC9798117.1 putative sulfate exporter family transporter [Sinomicrobium weinanense]MBU3122989.1 putative sulfate exporter family transporter [Sinomicrobium weinanense]